MTQKHLMAISAIWFFILGGCGENTHEFQGSKPQKKGAELEPVIEAKAEPKLEEEKQEQQEEKTLDQKPAASYKLIEKVFDPFYEGGKATDIVIAIDTSGSMSTEARLLEKNMAGFLEGLKASGMQDLRVFVVGEDLSFEEVKADFLYVIDEKVGSSDALSVLQEVFLEDSFEPREQATLEVIVITDDNASEDYEDLKTPLFEGIGSYSSMRLHSIAGLKEGQDKDNAECFIENAGSTYQSIAKETGGIILDVCSRDWSKLLDDLKSSIVSYPGGEIIFEKAPSLDKPIVLETVTGEIEIGHLAMDASTLLQLPAGLPIAPNTVVTLRYWVLDSE